VDHTSDPTRVVLSTFALDRPQRRTKRPYKLGQRKEQDSLILDGRYSTIVRALCCIMRGNYCGAFERGCRQKWDVTSTHGLHVIHAQEVEMRIFRIDCTKS
jgi:hypothetical protein